MIISSEFKPCPYLKNAHLQTLWPRFIRSNHVPTTSERLELDDGDFIDLAWTHLPAAEQPIIILFHGLEGSVDSPYIQGILQAIVDNHWCGVVMHFRSCSAEMNRLARSYHSGETQDLKHVINLLAVRYRMHPMIAVAYSLGGNALLKYLGENTTTRLKGAVAVSVPFELNRSADQLQQGFARFYQWYLVSKLKAKMRKKFLQIKSEIKTEQIKHYHSFWQFDHHVTAPVHGFKSAQEYYQLSSSRQYLQSINTPTHILHSIDDPFLPPDAIPTDTELSAAVKLELTSHGGHVGFLSGRNPFFPVFWLERRIPQIIHELVTKSD